MVGNCDIDFFKLSSLASPKFRNFESLRMRLKFFRQLLKVPKAKFYGIPKVYIFHSVLFHLQFEWTTVFIEVKLTTSIF
jgi:hypothetical protein